MAVCGLIRKENEADRYKNEKDFPVGKVQFFQALGDVVALAEVFLVQAVTAQKEKHRDANFPEDTQMDCQRQVRKRD